MTQEYTPTTKEVSLHYAAHRLVTLEGDDNDLPTSYVVRRLDQVYGPEFDRWLAAHDAELQADAWDEGFTNGRDLAASGQPMTRNNPYRERKQ